ncbi:microprocessor complex subunit DGCR8-like [Stylophora pistillata]|uniref:Microprocessor complex subunit DGCR8 n=1 Tax=Stylophora pistillata TaxID=50429 RepID=A0A2B4RNZ4_STYPI|nr:microprocessor complex subunit DGCR8-like [Stylophora pistillata]PFX19331.1 Microprocessor complex subunit DGCR8 [Stylophora pistillata]
MSVDISVNELAVVVKAPTVLTVGENSELRTEIEKMENTMEKVSSSAGMDIPTYSKEESTDEEMPFETERIPLKRKSEEDLLDHNHKRRMTEGDQADDWENVISTTGDEKQEGENPTDEQERKVIILKGNLPKLALPEGWIALNHRSGGIIYLHKPSRVCTWSRPYHIGGGSVRKHDVPLAAIPCLHQKKGINQENTEETKSENGTSKSKNPAGSILNALNTQDVEKCVANTSVVKNTSEEQEETTDSNKNTPPTLELLDIGELGSYLSTIWEFQTLTSEQERYAVMALPQTEDDVELPSSLECLSYSVKGAENGKSPSKYCLLNAGGKTPVAILHEYCQRILKSKPVYLASESASSDSPFVAEVQIDGIKYGSGTGSSKKIARQIAAESTLEVLLPGMFKKIRDYQISDAELEFFDQVDILNPRLFEFCSKTSLPSPSQILEECLRRNQGICSSIEFKTVCGQNKSLSFIITCGKHTATGPCKNKRNGKQLASQHILKKLHPHLEKWGALIRIYCDRPTGSIKKYKKDDSETANEKSGGNSSTNTDLLERLKSEMRKMYSENENANRMDAMDKPAEPVFTVTI